jgi:hypothetical protein
MAGNTGWRAEMGHLAEAQQRQYSSLNSGCAETHLIRGIEHTAKITA